MCTEQCEKKAGNQNENENEYRVEVAQSSVELGKKVTILKQAGWQTCGGITINGAYYYQAMEQLDTNDEYTIVSPAELENDI